MADFEGSRGGGRTIVALLSFSRSAMSDVWKWRCGTPGLRLRSGRALEYYVKFKEIANA